MGLYDYLSNFIGSQVKATIISKLAEENKKNGNENRYKDAVTDTTVGVVLTWIEYKPVIGDLLKSLGGKRELLYKILASGGNKVSSKEFQKFMTTIGSWNNISRLINSWPSRLYYPSTIHFPGWCQALHSTSFIVKCSILLKHTWETNFNSDLQMVRTMFAIMPFIMTCKSILILLEHALSSARTSWDAVC